MKKIETAMILAAGRGVRMRHLTDTMPKPAIEVCQKPIITRIAEKLENAGIKKIVVNTCYKGEMIKEALKGFNNIIYSEEKIALETGGGVKNALPLLGNQPFFVCNADPVWIDQQTSVFTQLENAFDETTTDILLALVPTQKAKGDVQDGNYFIENDLPRRKKPQETNIPYIFTGIQILHPRIFKDSPTGAFSLRDLYDKAEQAARLKHVIFQGTWFHVGTPEALEETNNALKKEEENF